MIYDCFTFFNELDLLEIRLNVLDGVVDRFVLVEATKTFTNKDKPLYFKENKERFKKFEDKIIHIVVDTYPELKDAWDYEFFQRNSIARGLVSCNDTDTILVSDVDEIPNPECIAKYKNISGVKVFKQKMFYYFLNNINIINPFWANLSTKMLSYSDFKKNDSSAQKVRFLKGKLIKNGGWHFSYLGGAEKIALKIKSFAHQEYNKNQYTDIQQISERIEKGKDLFSEKGELQYVAVPLDSSFPLYLLEHQNEYRHLIKGINVNSVLKIKLCLNEGKQSVLLFLRQVKNFVTKNHE